MGEKTFKCLTAEGILRNMTAQVCEVNKALLSVKRLVAAGNTVVFGSRNGSFIEDNDTGERIWLEEESNGMYALTVWVPINGNDGSEPF